VNYNYRYRLRPSDALAEQLAWTVDTCRQVYNHFLHRLNRIDDTSAYSEQKLLPSIKKWWDDLKSVHSKVLQKVVQRLYDNLSTLKGLKENGHCVGELKWKGKGYYHSFEYSQSGFKLNQTSGRDSDELYLSKIGRIPVVAHRNQPDGAEVKTNRSPTEAGPDDKLASSTLKADQGQDQNVTKNLTSTALPRAAVLAYARQEEGQDISEGDIERIGSAMAENTDVAQVDLSTRVDISIKDQDSPQFVETYFDKMDKAFSSVRHDDQPSPFAVIARAQQNGSLESAQIRPYIDQYQTAVERLQSITVPKTFRDVHLKTLNSLERMLFALRRINSVSEDPVSAVIGVKELEKGLKANLEAVQMLNQKAKSYAESS